MPEIKERPILFSSSMVRAILEGRKTVTRRVVKIQPRSRADIGSYGKGQPFIRNPDATKRNPECPYGRPGDRMWVRETWYCDHIEVQRGPYLQPADMIDLDQSRADGELVYAADGLEPYEQEQPTWKPSIHMPRWASRILLEITDVRVQRLQAITDEQAQAEGMVYTDFGMQERPGRASVDGGKTFHPMKPQQAPGWHAGDATHPDQCLDRARWAFANLWKKINGDNTWDANPWVWCVSFKRVMP